MAAVLLGALAAPSVPALAAGDAQQSDTVKIHAKMNGAYLTVWDDSPTPNYEVHAITNPYYFAQEKRTTDNWVVEERNGHYVFKLDKGGRKVCLDSGEQPTLDSVIRVQNCNNSRSQEWALHSPTRASEGDWVTIRPSLNEEVAISQAHDNGGWHYLRLNRVTDSSDRLWEVPGVTDPEGGHAKATVAPVPNLTARPGGLAHPAVDVTNTGSARIGKRTVTLTPGPAGVRFTRNQAVFLQREGADPVPCKVSSGPRPTATCPDVPLDLKPGESARMETEVYTEGLMPGELPSVTFTIGELGSAKSDVLMVP